MSPAADAVIVGAGIVGAACAAALARDGLRVTVVEAAIAGGGATAAGMGHIVVMDDSAAQFALTRYSRELWNDLAGRLPASVEYQRCGTLWVAADEEEMAEVRRKAAFYGARGVRTAILDAAALAEAEPNLRPGLHGALLVMDDSVIYAPCAARWLLDQSGAVLRLGVKVAALRDDGVELSDGSRIAAGVTICAAGTWARDLAPALAMRPRKGHLAITDRYPGFVRHQLVELGYLKSAHGSADESVAFNVQPRATGQVLIGSSRQFGATHTAVDSRDPGAHAGAGRRVHAGAGGALGDPDLDGVSRGDRRQAAAHRTVPRARACVPGHGARRSGHHDIARDGAVAGRSHRRTAPGNRSGAVPAGENPPVTVPVRINGNPADVPRGTSVAAAVLARGEPGFRPLCGMGICFECRLRIDGVPYRRTCQTLCEPGMKIETGEPAAVPSGGSVRHPAVERTTGVLVVGAGPAGIAAACAARESGQSVLVVDDNPSPGGQIWRGTAPIPSPWAQRCARAGFEILSRVTVIDQPAPGVLLAESAEGICLLRYAKLILATGARERFLPFPGWTLPGVTGAGGLQALVKSGLEIRGKRVVVAGTGPLLVAVATWLRKCGAHIALIAEQAPWSRLLRFAPALAAHPEKTAGIAPPGRTALSAGMPSGRRAKGRASWKRSSCGAAPRRGRKDCDYLACGFGLVPNMELPLLLGCAVEGGSVVTNEWQETTVPGVYFAGDPGGLDLALAEGAIAGYGAAGRLDEARRHFAARGHARRFHDACHSTFRLAEDLKSAPQADTVICRCENVTWGALAAHSSWRSAKLETRCGMGPCQGRVCGSALEFLRGWPPQTVRPPLFPCRMESLL